MFLSWLARPSTLAQPCAQRPPARAGSFFGPRPKPTVMAATDAIRIEADAIHLSTLHPNSDDAEAQAKNCHPRACPEDLCLELLRSLHISVKTIFSSPACGADGAVQLATEFAARWVLGTSPRMTSNLGPRTSAPLTPAPSTIPIPTMPRHRLKIAILGLDPRTHFSDCSEVCVFWLKPFSLALHVGRTESSSWRLILLLDGSSGQARG